MRQSTTKKAFIHISWYNNILYVICMYINIMYYIVYIIITLLNYPSLA